ncbi:hypothetical protein GCM10022399_42350 [Terrabacter ginsenosidimutans]|uniref:Uncharacterized protein n=1 Tax=Terrabacter ginsenosidimutans TaxID=490575 RepID=A0ABP7ESX0_9MICO
MTTLPEGFLAASPDDTWADRRRADGTRTLWLLSGSGESLLRRWDSVDEEWLVASEQEVDSVREACQPGSEWLTLLEDEMTLYGTPDPLMLVDCLAVDGDGGDPDIIDWPFDVERFLSEDDVFDYEGDNLRRCALVNGYRVHFAPCGDQAVAFLSNEEEVLGDLMAEFHWGSEAGMGPGAGGWVLHRSGAQHAVTTPRGDNAGESMRGFTFQPEPSGTAQLLRQWMDHVEYSCPGVFGAAAIALEPLDPAGILSAERRRDWEVQLGALTSGYGETIELTVRTDPSVTVTLRAMLSSDDTYRSVQEALADPVKGDWMRAALAEGDLSPLMGPRD